MARTSLTPISVVGPYASDLASITWTAADPTNKNQFVLTGRELILIRNNDASTHNVTLSSVNDPYGRTGDITKSIPAGAYRAFWAGAVLGWIQSDGKFYLEADDANVEFAILKIPG